MATGDLTITWNRRARGLNDWIDSIDVPLMEESESYAVDVLADDGATVVRTLSVTDETAIYTAAQQAADFAGDYVYPLADAAVLPLWDGSGFGLAATGEWLSYEAGTVERSIDLIGQVRLDQIDAGLGTITLAVTSSGSLTIGYDFLAINDALLGSGAGPAVAIPAFTRSIRLKLTAGGAGVTVEAPFTITMAAAVRPVKVNIRQLGFASLAGFNGVAAL